MDQDVEVALQARPAVMDELDGQAGVSFDDGPCLQFSVLQDHVAVDVESDRGPAVTGELLHLRDGDAVQDELRDEAVAQVVRGEARDACLVAGADHRSPEGRIGETGEDQVLWSLSSSSIIEGVHKLPG